MNTISRTNIRIQDKLNMKGRGFLKTNNAGGQIISYVPDVPGEFYLDDLLVIMTVPEKDQKTSQVYVRLQDKTKVRPNSGITTEFIQANDSDFSEIRTIGHLRQKKNDLIVCAPTSHVKVNLSKTVFIATVPGNGKHSAPFYIRVKKYDKSKKELDGMENGPVLIESEGQAPFLSDDDMSELSA